MEQTLSFKPRLLWRPSDSTNLELLDLKDIHLMSAAADPVTIASE